MAKPAAEKKRGTLLELYDWVEVLVFSVSFVMILFSFCLRLAIVSGESMENTLYDKEALIISNAFYEPAQGDIIVFQSPNIGYQEPLVKRIIAVGGQTVDIDFDSWRVTVDGEVMDDPELMKRVTSNMRSFDVSFPHRVEEGKVFVMGDNRTNSKDSRLSVVGDVDERLIIGRVLFRATPISRFGAVD